MAAHAAKRTGGRRGAGRRKFALWALGVAALLVATAYATLRISLNRPRVHEAVCGWLSRTTGCEVTYGKLVPKAFPWRLAMTEPRAVAPGLDAGADSVELVLQLRPAEIREVRIHGANARVEWSARELVRRIRDLWQWGPSHAKNWEAMPPVVAEGAVLEWAPGGRPGFSLGECAFRSGAWNNETPLQATFRGELGAATNRVAADLFAGAPAEWWPHPGECPLELRVEAIVDDLPAAAVAAPALASAGLERPAAWLNACGILENGLTVSGAFADGPPHRTPPRSAQFEGRCRLPLSEFPLSRVLEADAQLRIPEFRWRRFDLREALFEISLRDGAVILIDQTSSDAPLGVRRFAAADIPAVLRAAAAP